MMLFIDANLFLAYFNDNDVHYPRAVQLLEAIRRQEHGTPFTSDYIFNEVVGVALRKFGKNKALILGRWIFDYVPIMNVDERALAFAWKTFSDSNLPLSLVDWSNIAVMQFSETNQIATFDKAFNGIPNVHVVR